MTAAIVAISVILVSFANGLHIDSACGRRYDKPGVQICVGDRNAWRNDDMCGCPCDPSEWPDDGAGAHSGPQRWHASEDEDDNFIGAE